MSRKKKPYYPINQLCKVIDCEHKTAPYIELSEYLVVRTNNVRNGILVLDDIKYTTKEGFIEWTQRAVPEYGDVLFTREAPAGETCLVPSGLKICLGQRMVLLRPNKDIINSHFLSFYLTSKECRREIYQYVIGSTVTRINIDDILQIKIFCPSIAEQEKIASFLGAVDRRLTQLRCKQELLQTYKRGVMQKIFSQEIRFKQDDGEFFPNWQETTLGKVANFSKGKGLPKEDLVESGNLKCIRYAELYTLYDEVIDKVFSSTNVEPGNLILSLENDVIIPASGESAIEIAKAACVKISGVALGGDLNIIKSSINGEFLAYYLNHYRKKDIARVAQGNTVVHLYSSQLAQIEIEIPSQEEQKKIVNFLTMINQKIKAVSQQIDHTEQFKKGLLQKMFV
ncbi:restriction endonuclease subunit S [Nostoc sp. CCY0012]|uniref:restriction endonuclease subunit S n=1 Tax=Nostoc sp. CCY0012 TaxID=1056123 RepID=UPI0039C6FF05